MDPGFRRDDETGMALVGDHCILVPTVCRNVSRIGPAQTAVKDASFVNEDEPVEHSGSGALPPAVPLPPAPARDSFAALSGAPPGGAAGHALAGPLALNGLGHAVIGGPPGSGDGESDHPGVPGTPGEPVVPGGPVVPLSPGPVSPVPEPASWLPIAGGRALLWFTHRRRRR